MERNSILRKFRKGCDRRSRGGKNPDPRGNEECAREYPALFQRYQTEGVEIAKAAAIKTFEVPDAVAAWQAYVDLVARRDMSAPSVAMTTARIERPDLYLAFQSA